MTRDHERDMRIYHGSFANPGNRSYEYFDFRGNTTFLVVTVDWNQTGLL